MPHLLATRLREYGYSAQLIGAAHEINQSMPVYLLQRIADALNDARLPIKGSRLLLLGMAYEAGSTSRARRHRMCCASCWRAEAPWPSATRWCRRSSSTASGT